MLKTLRVVIRDIRVFLARLSRGESLAFLVIWVLIVLRVMFPIKHMPNGYVLYLDPIKESELCVLEEAGCDVDVSRTFTAAGTLGLTALGIGYLNRKRKLARREIRS